MFLLFLLFRFSFTRQWNVSNNTHEVELLKLFSMFLLGSSKKTKLNIASDNHQLDAVLDVLKNNPTCFEKLEEIEVDIYDLNMLGKILEVSILIGIQ
jgi:hypothetical protein